MDTPIVSINDRFPMNTQKPIINAQTGEVKAGRRKVVLKSDGIGSCGIVIAYDYKKKIGALAHIMLPGRSPNNGSKKNTKYAVDAIDEMLYKMERLGAVRRYMYLYLVGGGNVLKDKDDTICTAVIGSIHTAIKNKNMYIAVQRTGGTLRRSISLDVESGHVYYTVGNRREQLLCKNN